jgi:4-amino-4-deoxy-L-arabinose transferase-like glycosyltransferase
MTKPGFKKSISNRGYHILAGLVLVLFFCISLNLITHESVTTDEEAHIPAAYSYVMYGNFSLNPEHPPLAKLIAGVGFIDSHYNYPTNLLNQHNEVGQREWQVGNAFLYQSGNNINSILLRTRLPLLIASTVGLLITYLLFCRITTRKIAFLTLFFTALSPTVIGHGHLVTTDVLVMNTITISILCFIQYLRKPTRLYAVIAGITLGIAELSKFSAALLLVLFPLGACLYIYANKPNRLIESIKRTIRLIWPVFLITFVIIYITYAFQIIHLTHAAQDNWIIEAININTYRRVLLDVNVFPLLAPIARYLVGLIDSLHRLTQTNGANLLGKDYANGTPIYFPVVSILKAPTPLLFLWFIAFVWGVSKLKKSWFKIRYLVRLLLEQLRNNLVPTFGAIFVIIYFVVACTNTLDIGVRHLLPLFPWVAFFSSLWMVNVLEKHSFKKFPLGKIVSGAIVASFLFIALFIFPNYIPYTTELAGAAPNSYRYYNDSNVDWGQSAKYLVAYAQTHPKILPLYALSDEELTYYFCGSTTVCSKLRIISDTTVPPPGSYYAVSEMQLTIEWGWKSGDNLAYLKKLQPVAKVADVMYLYHMPYLGNR